MSKNNKIQENKEIRKSLITSELVGEIEYIYSLATDGIWEGIESELLEDIKTILVNINFVFSSTLVLIEYNNLYSIQSTKYDLFSQLKRIRKQAILIYCNRKANKDEKEEIVNKLNKLRLSDVIDLRDSINTIYSTVARISLNRVNFSFLYTTIQDRLSR